MSLQEGNIVICAAQDDTQTLNMRGRKNDGTVNGQRNLGGGNAFHSL